MMRDGAWPPNMKYINCDEYDNTNAPSRNNMNLVKYFRHVKEPITTGNLILAEQAPFNGFSYLQFVMEMNAVSIRAGASVNTQRLGSWTAALKTGLHVTATTDILKLQASVVYRVYTVVVSVCGAQTNIRLKIYIFSRLATAVHHARSEKSKRLQGLLH